VAAKIHVFLISALAGGQRQAPVLYPEQRVSGNRWIVGSVGPKASLDDVEWRQFLTLPGLELRLFGHAVRSQWLYRLRYSAS
jgi:hypothetical protein